LAAIFDGVLASFENGYADLLTSQTGITFPKGDPNFPAKWYWTGDFGVTKEQDARAWETIKASGCFWGSLEPMPRAVEALALLRTLKAEGHNVYFITNRMGQHAKNQTEWWLMHHGGFPSPTVCLAEKKGPLAVGLDLDVFIDDKPENCLDVFEARTVKSKTFSPDRHLCQVFLVDRPYNRAANLPAGIIRVPSALHALRSLQTEDALVAA